MNNQGNRACDECRSRKIKCKPTPTSCEACDKKQTTCTFANPIMKRGPKPRTKSAERLPESLNVNDLSLPGITIIPPAPRSVLQPAIHLSTKATTALATENGSDKSHLPPAINVSAVKSDNFGCLSIALDPKGRKVANYYLCIQETPEGNHYSHVSTTSLVNHPLSYLDAKSCTTYQVLGLLTSQQIYITIVFFAHVYPHYPSLDLADFNKQLKLPMTTSLLFLLNCICAVACPYGSTDKARFDKTQFYYKALEINYYCEEPQISPNWSYGHTLLKLSKQAESASG
ncbi:hypothetical protein DSO57_1025427 [Entomophthora muscae]|uniref:Uncharacterized protein n=1 Tax=Entomophthora muscae TaxID=34485 RepID=A0ACC2U0E4_9FUNG|nr:hypothetical protein DSO57_1025427 [Entomophthora muscae]